MKSVLLAGVAALALALPPREARAQFCANCTQEVTEVIREGKRALEVAKQIGQGAQMIGQGVQQIQIARNTFDAFTNIHDLGSAVHAFGLVGIQNPLPISPYALQNLLNGTGGTQGMISNMSNLHTGASSANTRFQVPLTHWAGAFLMEQVSGVSGSQAASLQLHQTAAERANHIQALQAQIALNAGNPAAQASLANQLAAYQAQTQNQSVQAAAVANYSAMRREAAELIREQRLQQSFEEILQAGRARGFY